MEGGGGGGSGRRGRGGGTCGFFMMKINQPLVWGQHLHSLLLVVVAGQCLEEDLQ